jgi:HD-like signal output (HDOD) protein/DNA-binding response OmpR family regulator
MPSGQPLSIGVAMTPALSPASSAAGNRQDAPLILLFSPRQKIRSVLAAGLMHANYRILEAETPYVASVKANQYVPDVVLVDINKDNIRDFLFLTRLESSVRTQGIAILVSVTADVRLALSKISEDAGSMRAGSQKSRVQLIEYPFHFSKLKERIETIVAATRKDGDDRDSLSPENRSDRIGAELFETQVQIQTKFHDIESTIRRQWAYPFTVVRAFDIIGNDKSCGNELSRCIESDLAATSAVLGLANKIYYAKRTGSITKVFEAIMRIGFTETRNILASLLFIDITGEMNRKHGFRRIDFWMHSLSTALIAEQLCTDCQYPRPELGFLAGLLHDIGKIPLDNNFTQVFPRLLEETTTRISAFHEVEQQMMGFTHADFGHHLMGLWNFPSYIAMTVLNHHNPERILESRVQGDRIIQSAVFSANLLAKALSMGHSCDEVLKEIPTAMLKDLKIPAGLSNSFIDKIFQKFRRYFDYMHIATADVTIVEPKLNSKKDEILIVHGQQTAFHPCFLALKIHGYRLASVNSLPEKVAKSVRVALFLPDKGSPLDIMVTEEGDSGVAESTYLRIFLLDGLAIDQSKREFSESNIIIMDRNRLDMRLLLHVVEDHCYGEQLRRLKEEQGTTGITIVDGAPQS